MSTVEGDTSSAVSAKFLQARITALSTTLIKRLENIFAAALEEDSLTPHSRIGTGESETSHPPSLTDTAVKQLQLDVESTALIRAAEELMMLTRSMKELWLFGGLNTIPEKDSSQFGITAEERLRMEEDEKFVMNGIREYLNRLSQVDQRGVDDKNGINKAASNGTGD